MESQENDNRMSTAGQYYDANEENYARPTQLGLFGDHVPYSVLPPVYQPIANPYQAYYPAPVPALVPHPPFYFNTTPLNQYPQAPPGWLQSQPTAPYSIWAQPQVISPYGAWPYQHHQNQQNPPHVYQPRRHSEPGNYAPIPSQQPPTFEVPVTEQRRRSVVARHSATRQPSTALQVRGPPLKPRMAGFAIWVGNVPPNLTIYEFRDYFSDGFKDSILSVFPIYRSSSAFINYSSEADCQRALEKFDGQTLRNSRLVCRLRYGSQHTASENPSSTSFPTTIEQSTGDTPTSQPSGPQPSNEASADSDTITASPDEAPEKGDPSNEGHGYSEAVSKSTPPDDTQSDQSAASNSLPTTTPRAIPDADALQLGQLQRNELHGKENSKERYFIMKALSVDDLKISERDGIWTTQSHNEKRIMDAIQNSTVYLIFSANRSGEFYGYARVTGTFRSTRDSSSSPGPIDENAIDRGSSPAEVKITEETDVAPEGYIFFDISRGTLFWDAGTPTMDLIPAPDNGSGERRYFVNSLSSTTQFVIQWENNSRRVHFKNSVGLTNTLGDNKPVQVAKDGTELDPAVGRRLVSLFHTVPEPFNSPDTGLTHPPASWGA